MEISLQTKVKRMDDNIYVTEFFHDVITEWYRVRSEIVKILNNPMQVYKKPLEVKDEVKEQELELLCQDFRKLNKEVFDFVQKQIVKMVQTYSEMNCLRQELVNLQTDLVDQYNTKLKI